VTPEEAVRAIHANFAAGTFEYYQMNRKNSLYLVGLHTRLSNQGYIEIATITPTHVHIWKLSKKGLEVIGK